MNMKAETNQSGLTLKRALKALEDMQSKLETLENNRGEPIAVIGMGCRFPGGSDTPEMFWQFLHRGEDAITEVPANRWNLEDYYDRDPDVSGKMYTRHGGFIGQLQEFDPHFFGVSPRETVSLDPQQRLLLEVSWEALEYAGINPQKLEQTSTGVFVGICNLDYYRRILNQSPEKMDAYVASGNAYSTSCGRLSYLLGLTGPSLAVDTACSSSLVAVHLACSSLQNHECNLAITGGVNRIISPEHTINLCRARMLSKDGRCKTFDAQANGFIRGEGCGMVVLKRLSDAQKEGDNILAVIRGTAVNQDGRSAGLTVPNGPSQESVIRQALERGGLNPEKVSYIEAHGTGTSLGDPIEVEALGGVFGNNHTQEQPLVIGSVKTNIGHLESAAGIAGLIKVILQMIKKEIVPNLHFNQPNPLINWENLPLVVPTEVTPWQCQNDERRIAGVSSFGFGGTNAHVILEASYAQVNKENTKDISPAFHLFTLSAKTPKALQELADLYQHHLQNYPQLNLGDVCYTVNTGRACFDHRLAVVAPNTQELANKLRQFVMGGEVSGLSLGKRWLSNSDKIALLFTGQGSQYMGMGKELYETESVFKANLDRCAEILAQYLGKPLLDIIYDHAPESTLINETAYTQPALFAIEYSLYQLWQSWGIEPSVVMGHSIGEYVAACVAGVFSVEDGLKLIAHRGKLMQSLPSNGKMASVLTDEMTVKEVIASYGEKITIAAYNGQQSIVISGETEAIDSVIKELEAQEIKVKPLTVSHAFHSPLMKSIIPEFREIAQSISYSAPKIKLISNVTGKRITTKITNAEYWCQHILQPVRFADSFQEIEQEGYKIFVEVGPKPILLGMGKLCVSDTDNLWIPSLRPQHSDLQQIKQSLGELFINGVNINWQGFYKNTDYQKIALPTYPFQRQKYWFDFDKDKKSNNESPKLLPWENLLLTENKRSEFLEQIINQRKLSPEESQVLPKLMAILAEEYEQQKTRESLNDLLYQVEWQEKSSVPDHESKINHQVGYWLIFADSGGMAIKVADKLEQQGQKCFIAYADIELNSGDKNKRVINPLNEEDLINWLAEIKNITNLPLQGIIHCWSLDATPSLELTASSLAKSQELSCGSVLSLIKALAKSEEKLTRGLWLVTQGGIAVKSESPAVAQSPLWGMGKVIALEHSQWWGGMIDVDTSQSVEQNADSIFQEITNPDEEEQIAFREQKRYVARLVRYEFPENQNRTATIKSDSAYLITGGLGALGLEVAKWMVQQGAKQLILLGRSPASADKLKVIGEMEKQGATITVAQGDVAEYAELKNVWERFNTSTSPIKGIIHTAGVLDDGILLQQEWSRFEQVMNPKVIGTWNLHSLTENADLDFFVCFSGVVSVLGSMGQGNYASANAFMDVFTYYRQNRGLPCLTINWGPWADVGMAAKLQISKKNYFGQQGIELLTINQGFATLERFLPLSSYQISVISIDWSIFKKEEKKNPFLSSFLNNTDKKIKKVDESNEQENINLLTQLKVTPIQNHSELIVKFLGVQIAKVLGLNPSQIDLGQPLIKQGFDSLMAVELRNKVSKEVFIDIPLSVLMKDISLIKLKDYLINKLNSKNSVIEGKL